MIEKPKRPKQPSIQERQPPRTLQELIKRYDLDNTNIYDFLDELVIQLNDKNVITAGANSSVTLTENGNIQVPITVAINRVGNKFTIANNRVYIGKGIKNVLVSAEVYCNLVANRGSIFNLAVHKNGVTIAGQTNNGYANTASRNACISIAPMLIEVKEGDYFEYFLYGYSGDVIRSDSKANTYLTLEAVN